MVPRSPRFVLQNLRVTFDILFLFETADFQYQKDSYQYCSSAVRKGVHVPSDSR